MGNSSSNREITLVEEKDVIRVDFEFPTPIVGVDMSPILHVKYPGTCIIEWFRETEELDAPKRASMSINQNDHSIDDSDSISLYNGLCYVPTNEDLTYKLRLKIILFDDEYYLQTGKCFCKEIITKPVIQMPSSVPRRTLIMNPDENILDYRAKTRLLLTYYKPDFSFSVGSYTLSYIKHVLHPVTIPELDFIKYSVYRRRLIYREIIQSDVDVLALQNISSAEYHEWNLDLSKIGYSNINHITEIETGNCTFYKRSKFSRFNDTKVTELEYDDSVFKTLVSTLMEIGNFTEDQINLQQLKSIASLHSERMKSGLPSICSLVEFEMKDNAEILKVFNHELNEDKKNTKLRPNILFDQVSVLSINFSLHSLYVIEQESLGEEVNMKFLLLQIISLFRNIRSYIASRVQQQPKLRLGITFCGNIGTNTEDTILHKYIENQFGFTDPYKVITGDEFKFLSNFDHTKRYNSNHIWFSKEHFQTTSIVSGTVQVPQLSIVPQDDSENELAFPNENFVCEEPMLKCEIQWIDPYEKLDQ